MPESSNFHHKCSYQPTDTLVIVWSPAAERYWITAEADEVCSTIGMTEDDLRKLFLWCAKELHAFTIEEI